MHKDGTSRFKLVFINKGEDIHIIFRTHGGRNDGVILIDDLFEASDTHRRASKVIYLGSVLFVLVFLGFEALLVGHKLFLHEEVIFDAFKLEEAELTFGGRGNNREASGGLGPFLLALLAANTGGRRRGLILLLFLLFSFFSSVVGVDTDKYIKGILV